MVGASGLGLVADFRSEVRRGLTVAPRLFMLCDNRPGVGRDGAGSFPRKRSQPIGRLSKRAARRGVGSTFGAS